MLAVASRSPPYSNSDLSCSWNCQRCSLANLAYMSRSSPAKRPASIPPTPARTSIKAARLRRIARRPAASSAGGTSIPTSCSSSCSRRALHKRPSRRAKLRPSRAERARDEQHVSTRGQTPRDGAKIFEPVAAIFGSSSLRIRSSATSFASGHRARRTSRHQRLMTPDRRLARGERAHAYGRR